MGDTAKSMFDRWTAADESPADPRYYDPRVYQEKKAVDAQIRAEQQSAVPTSAAAAPGVGGKTLSPAAPD
ncbi:MAG: hypothetical protein ACLQNE_27050 [Thermoguttaceae bacterium]|jgi:hypothetical protein